MVGPISAQSPADHVARWLSLNSSTSSVIRSPLAVVARQATTA
jgi:hypothetical protein